MLSNLFKMYFEGVPAKTPLKKKKKMHFGHGAWRFIPVTPAPGRLREEQVHKFKASLVYVMSSGLARAAE